MIQETTNFAIVEQVRDDLEDAFSKVDNGYDTVVREIVVGQYTFEDMKTKPSISLYPFQEDIQAKRSPRDILGLYMYTNLYMKHKDGWINLLKFTNDVNSFLLYSSDNTYLGETFVVPPTVYFIGWKNDPVLISQIQFYVRYINNN